MDLKPGNVLVKADTFQGKRKIKDRWEDKPHDVVCQKLAFPCMWVSTKYGTDVPPPPQ